MKKIAPDWLKSAVFYEIYPSSFFDSNGDGIGDLPGIIAKLDYLTSLGVNAVWLNPCFVSPFSDGGYDIADYLQVAPRYGTNEDLKNLFDRARELGIRICLDLVPGHTSIEHPWFKASSKAERNEYSDYYIWNSSWLDSGGGMPMISGCAERDASYITNYFAFQPALNYGFAEPDPDCPWQMPVDHPAPLKMREEMKNIMRFWLDLGAAGFRCDMAPYLIKKDPGKKANSALWQEMRRMLDDEYPEAVLLSEWGYAPLALNAGFHCDFMLHCGTPAYTSLLRNDPERDFWKDLDKTIFFEKDGNDYTITNTNSYFDAAGKGDAKIFFDIYLDHYRRTRDKGFILIPTGDHDMPRISDQRNEADLACIFAFILTMPGVPLIYYGDEIGMKGIKGLVSKEGGYTRTQARTPMQWDDSENAGFSTAAAEKLYLPVDDAPDAPNIAEQQQRSGSLWNTVKELIHLRKHLPSLLADSDFKLVLADYPMVYIREKDDQKLLIVIQPANRQWSSHLPLPEIKKLSPLVNSSVKVDFQDDGLELSGSGTGIGVFMIQPDLKDN